MQSSCGTTRARRDGKSSLHEQRSTPVAARPTASVPCCFKSTKAATGAACYWFNTVYIVNIKHALFGDKDVATKQMRHTVTSSAVYTRKITHPFWANFKAVIANSSLENGRMTQTPKRRVNDLFFFESHHFGCACRGPITICELGSLGW